MKQLFGLIGQPVAGSKSPWIHECLFRHAQMDAAYWCFDVSPESLEAAVNGLRALGLRGFNVTIPHKEAIMPLLNDLSPQAKQLGAVNTVLNVNGQLIGHNTDGPGLLAVLNRHLGDLSESRILVIGAGGAARGICGALVSVGVKSLTIQNRSPERALALIEQLNTLGTTPVSLWTEQSLNDPYDLIINTTSVGMAPQTEASPIDLDQLRTVTAVCDIVYKPHETQLIKVAKARGIKVIYGIEMLIEQALIAESIWNDLSSEMLNEVRQALLKQASAL